MSRRSRNLSGQTYALTVLTPITRGRESTLARRIDALPVRDGSPLARVPGTHFARWVVIDAVVYQGGRQPRDQLSAARLLFTTNFDGPLDAYLEGLRTGLGADADAIWGDCEGYPGHTDAAFADYLRAHEVESSLFFAAYGQYTVDQVKTSLALRSRLIDFALHSQGMSAEDLQTAFHKVFPP